MHQTRIRRAYYRIFRVANTPDLGKSDVNLVCDALHDGVLHGQHIFEFTIVTLGPDVGLIACLDELNSDTYAVRRSSNAALDKVVGLQFLSNILRPQHAPFVLGNRTARDHFESIPIQFSDLSDHLFSQPLAEELLVRVSA